MSAAPADPYVRFNREFFARWAPFYDLFAGSIAWVYTATIGHLGPLAGTTVLDLCTGTGEIARRAAAGGALVTGIDLSGAMLARARRKLARRGLAGTLLEMDARALAFSDRAFDTVVISFGLHDMPPAVRAEVLAEAVRVARRRLVVADYDLGSDRLAARLWERAIGWVETPYFRSFARSGALPLLRRLPLVRIRRHRLFPAFAVFEAKL